MAVAVDRAAAGFGAFSQGGLEAGADGGGGFVRLDHRATTGLSAGLALADVDRGRAGQGGLDDAAGGIADQDRRADQGPQVVVAWQRLADLHVVWRALASVLLDGTQHAAMAAVGIGVDDEPAETGCSCAAQDCGHRARLGRGGAAPGVADDEGVGVVGASRFRDPFVFPTAEAVGHPVTFDFTQQLAEAVEAGGADDVDALAVFAEARDASGGVVRGG